MVACLTTACTISVMALSVAAAWFDFTARDEDIGLDHYERLTKFFSAHSPFELSWGLWLMIAPGASIAFIAVLWIVVRRVQREAITEVLAGWTLMIGAGSAAFILGSMMTETRFPRGLLDISDLVFPPIPVILLGALTAWTAVKLGASMPRPASTAGTGSAFAKLLSSASQISVLTLVLLYLGISQTSGFAGRTAAFDRTPARIRIGCFA